MDTGALAEMRAHMANPDAHSGKGHGDGGLPRVIIHHLILQEVIRELNQVLGQVQRGEMKLP